jgi:hypothetical protein
MAVKIDQMDIKYSNIFHCYTLQKKHIGIFGLKKKLSGNPASNGDKDK